MEQRSLATRVAQQATDRVVEFARVEAWFLKMKRPRASLMKLPSVGGGEGLVVPGFVQGIAGEWFINTGTDVSILNPEMLEVISKAGSV